MSEPIDPIACAAGCKRTVADADAALQAGWELLPITGRYRCAVCWRDLNAASTLPGTEAAYRPDPLPADSIGALKRLPERQPLHEKPR